MTIWENVVWKALKESLLKKAIDSIFQYKTDLTKAALFRLNIINFHIKEWKYHDLWC